MWQDGPEVNPSILIGFYLVTFFLLKDHSHGNSHKSCIVGCESWEIQNKQVWSECHIINYLV